MDTGTDYSRARPDRAFFVRHNLRFACRYLLDDARDGGKALKRAEAQQLTAWGVKICANFEYSIGGMLRGYTQGVADARTSLAELKLIGAPRNVVYFSCDTDISIAQIPLVLDYMRGAASMLGKENVGVYGEYDLIQAAHAAGYRWLWQCYAWSRGLWSPHATVRQVHNGAFPGEYDADLDTAMVADYGQWDTNGWTPREGAEDDMTPEEHQWLEQLNRLFMEGKRLGPDSGQTSGGGVPVAWIVRVVSQIIASQAAVLAEVDTSEESLAALTTLVGGIQAGDPAVIVDALKAALPGPVAVEVANEFSRRTSS